VKQVLNDFDPQYLPRFVKLAEGGHGWVKFLRKASPTPGFALVGLLQFLTDVRVAALKVGTLGLTNTPLSDGGREARATALMEASNGIGDISTLLFCGTMFKVGAEETAKLRQTEGK
jgi:hypothetical protein